MNRKIKKTKCPPDPTPKIVTQPDPRGSIRPVDIFAWHYLLILFYYKTEIILHIKNEYNIIIIKIKS